MGFDDDFSMNKMDTIHVVPVDLNIFLCKVEGCLASFYAQIGCEEKSAQYKVYQRQRVDGIVDILWDEKHGQFRDWNFNYTSSRDCIKIPSTNCDIERERLQQVHGYNQIPVFIKILRSSKSIDALRR